ncbi:MAG: porin family protein, partial [Burkholderia sp.]|nr:porin family protein [Burkholderia sp.]
MHKITRSILAASVVLLSQLPCAQAAPQAGASQFAGPYVGFKLGVNNSDASGAFNKASHNTVFPGFTAGYNFDVQRFVVGAEAFADLHHGSTTFKDAGI